MAPSARNFSFIAAPLLFGASTFFWTNGSYGITGGTLLALSMVPWILALCRVFGWLRAELPVYSSAGLFLAVWGAVSGACFGLADVFTTAFGIPHLIYLQVISEHSLAFDLLLFWPGPLFPLSLLVLSVILMRRRLLPAWPGVMLALGAVLFPLSRIARVEGVAHLADGLLALPFWYLGFAGRAIEPPVEPAIEPPVEPAIEPAVPAVELQEDAAG
jgi:hypothetical protein